MNRRSAPPSVRQILCCILGVAALGSAACGRAPASEESTAANTAAMAPWCEDVEPPGPIRDGGLAGPANPDPILMSALKTYGQAHAGTYAGEWIDRERGGTVVIAFTDDPAPHRTALADLRPSPNDVSIIQPRPPITDTRSLSEAGFAFDVVQVARNQAELNALQAQATSLLSSTDLGVNGTGQSTQLNRVNIHLRLVDDDARRLLAQLLPADAVCVEGTYASTVTTLDPAIPTTLILPADADPIVSCSDFTFPLSAVDQEPGFERTDDPLAVAFREGLAANPMFYNGGESAGQSWVLLAREDERALLGTGGLRMQTVTMEFTGERWIWNNSGGCQVRAALPAGLGLASWAVAEPPTPDDSEIHLLVTEQSCTGAQPIGDRLVGPEVRETDDQVLIAFAVRPLEGGAFTCPGNPSTPVTVTLDAPLGDRELVDGTVPRPQ